MAAQFFYTARALVQWIKSEKSKKIESPTIFWIFSLLGSSLFFFYGYLRDDFSIIFGELLSYYIYMWNLKAKGILTHIPKAITWVFAFVPVAILCMMLKDFSSFTTFVLQKRGFAYICHRLGQCWSVHLQDALCLSVVLQLPP